jgi:hypothetical protein
MSVAESFVLSRSSKVYQNLYTCRIIFALLNMNVLSKKDMSSLDDLKARILQGNYISKNKVR